MVIDLDADLAHWVDETAARNGVAPEELIELLVKMESGRGERARDGRKIGFRAGMYRGASTLLVDDRSNTGTE
ncbi:hypothetical protein [Methylopila sp. M107]|uniref:hypothetical protein n=1 Tax=Methylopila sp. M107 TaxID=1101190 RepID=UPI0012DCC1B0|nr:hypothetical protein [Methylopila sp. M107]